MELEIDQDCFDSFDTPALTTTSSSPASEPLKRSPSPVARDEGPRKRRRQLRLELESDDGDDLPTLSQIPPVVSVTHVDLARAKNATTSLTGKTFEGRPITFRKKYIMPKSSLQATDNLGNIAKSLLPQPMHLMLRDIEDIRKTENQHAEQADPLTAENIAALAVNDTKGKKKHGQLWTDKYRPSKYMDLLGDDRVNRSAMSWLKEWDACVFKTAAAQNARKKALVEKRKRAKEEQIRQGNTSYSDNILEDPLGRPLEKVLLLSGPPGLGKTTLAHVLARQAGYQVHEINASDDRSAKVVSDRIRDALESRAITLDGRMSSNRPTCVVIDEIDGASGAGDTGFVRSLVKFILDGSKIPKKGGKAKKDQKPLLRPIICICNDLYAPVLRPLRPLARLIRFSPPPPNILISRIKDICDAEKLIADGKSLTALVSLAEGDLRTCLNTLQILKTKTSKLNEAEVRSTALGLKDTGTSPASVWDRLFKVAYNRKGKTNGEEGLYVDRLVRDVATCGEYDKLIQGCFEHYLRSKFPTDGWKNVEKALDWISFYDRIDSSLKSDHNFELYPYLPYCFVAWYPLFANVANKGLEWPKADYEAYLKKQAHQDVSEAIHKNIPTSLRSSFNATQTTVELIPALMRILSPDLKLIGGLTAKQEERLAINKLIKVMTAFKIAYVQDRNEDGQLTFKLEPAIDVFIHYDGKRASDVPPSRYAIRQLIATHMENARKNGEELQTTSTADQLLSAYKGTANESAGGAASAAVDFFGRPIVIKEEDSAMKKAKQIRFTYKYHEGSSNAVKLPVKMETL